MGSTRSSPHAGAVFAAFDVLSLEGRDVMPEPWVDRRKRLEDVFARGISEPRLQLEPTPDDAARLWTVLVVERGGEGIVPKDPRSSYRHGALSRCWLTAKCKLVLPSRWSNAPTR